MLKFNKAYEVRELMRRSVKRSDLITGLFQDCPELEEVTFSYSQEYDDNNYSDSSRLLSVNGHPVDWDMEYEDEEEAEEVSTLRSALARRRRLPRPDRHVLAACRDLVELVAAEFGYGEDHTLQRNNYKHDSSRPIKGDLSDEEAEYLHSYLTGSELPAKWFLKKDAKWACYYALDHGRFDEKTEFKLFAKKNRAKEAYWYAFHVIKGRLPEPIENFLILSSMDGEENHWLKKYMEFRENMVEVA